MNDSQTIAAHNDEDVQDAEEILEARKRGRGRPKDDSSGEVKKEEEQTAAENSAAAENSTTGTQPVIADGSPQEDDGQDLVLAGANIRILAELVKSQNRSQENIIRAQNEFSNSVMDRLDNYQQLFVKDRYFWTSLRVTLLFGLYVVPGKVILALIIAMFLKNFASLPVVQHAFAGIRVCVCVLIVQAVLRLWKKSVVDAASLVIYLAVFLLNVMSFFLPVRIPAAVLVILSGVAGVLISSRRYRKAQEGGEAK